MDTITVVGFAILLALLAIYERVNYLVDLVEKATGAYDEEEEVEV